MALYDEASNIRPTLLAADGQSEIGSLRRRASLLRAGAGFAAFASAVALPPATHAGAVYDAFHSSDVGRCRLPPLVYR
jgi:hypothetical protein